MVSSLGRAVRSSLVVIACLAPVVASAQSTWLPTTGTTPWITGTAWSDGIIPSAIDAVTVFPAAGPTILLDNTTVTVGTISQTTASGNVVIGSTTVGTDWIDLAVSSGVPLINVTNGNLFMYAQLSGSQGLRKTGNGIYSPRYNPLDYTYTGTNSFGGGTIQIARDGQLGAAENPIEVTASTNLQSFSFPTSTLTTNRSITISAGQLTIQNGVAANTFALGGALAGSGSLALNTGNFQITGPVSYTGATTVRSATVSLSGGALLSPAALTLQTSATNTGGSLVDFGGGNQTVASLAVTLVSNGTGQVTNTFRNGSLAVTGGNLNVGSGAATAQTGTTRLDLTGLSSFSWGNGTGNLVLNTTSTVASSTSATIMSLPVAGTASLAAAHVQIGNSADRPASSVSTLLLGLANSISTGTLTVGAYRGNGVMAFAPEVSGGSLVLRGPSGGDSRVNDVFVGFKGGGDNFGNGTLDVSAGTIDARVSNFNVGYYFVLASSGQTGVFTMSSGTVDATAITLGNVNTAAGSAGSPTITGSFAQTGGLVRGGTLTLGVNVATGGTTNNPTFRSTYALAGGTLAVGSITSGTGFASAGSQRRVNWTGGTITTLDAATDLTVTGVSGSGGAVIVTVSGGDAKTFDVPTGRTATLGDFVSLTGSSTGFTKTGAGTLVLGGTNGYISTFSGSVTVQGGRLNLASSNALPAGTVVPVAGGTLTLAPYLQTTVGGLDPSAGGLTDVGSGMVTVAAGLSAPTMVAAIVSGLGDGTWNGTSGITSSVAAASGGDRTVGWLDNGDGTVTFAFAAAGDTNLDWQVDIIDAANFLAGGKFDSGAPATWNEGDFTYDGVVDILDAASFLSNGLFDAGSYNPPPGQAGAIAAVPEPTAWPLLASAAIAAVGVCGTLRRRRAG
jgi:fibronectin-binding autotransporter adhesin